MRDTYTPQDINPPADGWEPERCAVCGCDLDGQAHDVDCTEREPTQAELDAQERRDWRRYAGRETRYLRYGWGRR